MSLQDCIVHGGLVMCLWWTVEYMDDWYCVCGVLEYTEDWYCLSCGLQSIRRTGIVSGGL